MLNPTCDSCDCADPTALDELPFECDCPCHRPAPEYGPAANTFTCAHGVTTIGADDEDGCDACFVAELEAESLAMPNGWQDFPDDRRSFDDEAQADLALYDVSEFGLAMAANREARLEREAAGDAHSAALGRVARVTRAALKVTGAARRE